MAVATLTPLAHVTPQDQSRFCLSEALLHGRVSDDRCFLIGYDRASYHGHLYSDKAPGLSFVAMAPVLLLSPGSPARWSTVDMRLWGVRVLTVGVAFLLCALMVGRVSERLAPGFGGAALATFALGTPLVPFAAVGFEHVPAAALAFGAFLLAWSRRPALAGLVAGFSVVSEYQLALVLLVVGAYVALRGRRRTSPEPSPAWRSWQRTTGPRSARRGIPRTTTLTTRSVRTSAAGSSASTSRQSTGHS